jgi:hypothetical protein
MGKMMNLLRIQHLVDILLGDQDKKIIMKIYPMINQLINLLKIHLNFPPVLQKVHQKQKQSILVFLIINVMF